MKNKLTIVASNRDRFNLNSNSTKWFLKSLENQTCKDFELVIADGGSKNIKAIKDYFNKKNGIKMRVVEYKLGELFERAKLNNVGIRNANTQYIATTDVDMFFATDYIKTILDKMENNVFLESRTMYWKRNVINQIYSGKINPILDIDKCKNSRIKKRTTAGGTQCTHIDNWNKLRGFNEDMVGWGSEDVELLKRASKLRLKVIWIGEGTKSIKVFHQPHSKPNLKLDLQCQNKNLKVFKNSKQSEVNLNGWGGKYESN